jgi:hypothetical protein
MILKVRNIGACGLCRFYCHNALLLISAGRLGDFIAEELARRGDLQFIPMPFTARLSDSYST